MTDATQFAPVGNLPSGETPSDITFLVPFYKRIEHFKEYFEAGLWNDVKLQLVCDGSGPDFVQELRSMVAAREDIAIHAYAPNRGLARARAEGFAQVQTPYVALCDDDDFIPGASVYARQAAQALQANPDALLVTAPVVATFRRNSRANLQYDRRWLNGRTGLNLLNFIVRTGEVNALIPSVYRTADARNVEVNDIFRTNEDVVMLARLCAMHPERRIHVLEEGTYMRLQHANSISAIDNVGLSTLFDHTLALTVAAYHLTEMGEVTREEFAELLRKRGRVLAGTYQKGEELCRIMADRLLGRSLSITSEESRETLEKLEAVAGQLPWEIDAFTVAPHGKAQQVPNNENWLPGTSAQPEVKNEIEPDVTYITRLHDRLEHFTLRVHTGFWDGVRVQVVGDGTSPEQLDRLRTHVKDRKDIKVHAYQPNRGIAAARAVGFQQVDTPFAAVVDDDDYIMGAASFARQAADVLRTSSDVFMVATPRITTINPYMKPIEQWDMMGYDGLTALDFLEGVVRTGRIRQLGSAMFRTEDIRDLPSDDLFRHAEDIVMMARLCARQPERRIHVVKDESCAYVRLAHADAGSQTGSMTPEKVVLAMLAYSVGAYYLIEAGRMTFAELLEVFAIRGRIFQSGNKVGAETAELMKAFMQGQTPVCQTEETRRAWTFLQGILDKLPQEVVALRQTVSEVDSIQRRLEAGEAAIMRGEYRQALLYFEQINLAQPNNAAALCNAGLAYVGMGLTKEATAAFQKALRINPAFDIAFFNLVDILIDESLPLAVKAFSKYQDGIPDSEEKQAYAQVLLGTGPVGGDGAVQDLRAKVALVCGPDRKFIKDIERSLRQSYDVRTVYYDKQPDWSAIQRAMDWADVTWFEWFDTAFVQASRTLTKTSKVICRLHRYEAFTALPGQVNRDFVDHLVLVAPFMETQLRDRYPTLLKDVPARVILNGVDTQRFDFEDRQPGFDLAYIGYIHGRKNPSLVLQCLQALVKVDSRYRLHVAGVHQEPALELYWNHAIERMGLSDHVVMSGWVKDIGAWLRDKQYLISASMHESFGYGIAEAMSRGLKPLVHWYPGAETLFPAEHLFLSIDEFVQKVRSQEYDSASYRFHIEDNFSLGRQMREIESLVDELSGRKPPVTVEAWPGSIAKSSWDEFTDSKDYWEQRYAEGGNSGSGSYGRLAAYKAEVLNTFVKERGVRSVIEFGCGDGHQVSLAQYPAYVGLDVATSAVKLCREKFSDDRSKTFREYVPSAFRNDDPAHRADLSLSLDVIYHLVEDEAFDTYMRHLFEAGERYVVIYANDTDEQLEGLPPHIRFRRFTNWVEEHAPEWKMVQHVRNRYAMAVSTLGHSEDETFADFYIFQHESVAAAPVAAPQAAVPAAASGDGSVVGMPAVDSEVHKLFLDPDFTPDNADRYYSRIAILKSVKDVAPKLRGTVLDIGCGRMPYRSIITANPLVHRYLGLDLGDNHYADKQRPDLSWDGKAMPLDNGSVDAAMATEVMEHVPDPNAFLEETARVLRPGGLFFFTVPFVWPLHDVPYDEWRYTPFSLKRLLETNGFGNIAIRGTGGWNASMAQMLGLWMKRAPMNQESRKWAMETFFPFYKQLLESDTIPERLGESTMITGLTGTAYRR